MAITLPTFTVNDQAKQDRLLAAFKPTPTSTNAEAAAEYKKWLRWAITNEVTVREIERLKQKAAVDSETARTDLATLMDGST